MTLALHRMVGHLRQWADTCRGASPTDHQLLDRFARQRDEAAFTELVRRHGAMVLGAAQRVLHDRHDAEDVFQATFLVLARKAGSMAWRESISGWLFPVAHRLALRARANRERRRFHEAQFPVPPLSESADPQTPELRAVLDEELSRLPEHYRSVVVLCYLEDRTQQEAARQLGLSAGEVRGRLDRARERLRRRLQRRGWALLGGSIGAMLTSQAYALAALRAVPPALIDSTTKAAVLYAAHTSAAGLAAVASATALRLAQGALQTMFLAKLHHPILLVVAALLAGILSLPILALGDDHPRAAKAAERRPD